MKPSDKRNSARIQPFVARCKVLAEGQPALPAYVTDLGLGGAQVWSERQPPAVGTNVKIEIGFGSAASRSTLRGALKWANPPAESSGRHVFGVAFSELNPDEAAVLERVLGEFRRHAALLS